MKSADDIIHQKVVIKFVNAGELSKYDVGLYMYICSLLIGF